MDNSALLKSTEVDDTQDQLNKYVCIEIGKSAYTEFKMRSGEFETTEDGIFLGTVIAKDENEALELLENSPEHKDREFDNVILLELAKH
jgi:hypothetical protein